MTAEGFSTDLLDGLARRPPAKVRLLHASSSIVMVALVALAVLAVQLSVRTAAETDVPQQAQAIPGGGTALAAAPSARGLAAANGTTISAMLLGLDRAVASVRGDIVEVRLDDVRGADPRLTLRVELPGSEAAIIARLMDRMQSDGVEQPSVDSVTATPGGALLVVVGTVRPTTGPRSAAGIVPADADVSVRLAELATDAEVELRRIETGGTRHEGMVRLVAAGPLVALAGLVERIEDGPSSPARIRSVRVDRVSADGTHQLDVGFLLRERPRVVSSSGALGMATDRPRS